MGFTHLVTPVERRTAEQESVRTHRAVAVVTDLISHSVGYINAPVFLCNSTGAHGSRCECSINSALNGSDIHATCSAA